MKETKVLLAKMKWLSEFASSWRSMSCLSFQLLRRSFNESKSASAQFRQISGAMNLLEVCGHNRLRSACRAQSPLRGSSRWARIPRAERFSIHVEKVGPGMQMRRRLGRFHDPLCPAPITAIVSIVCGPPARFNPYFLRTGLGSQLLRTSLFSSTTVIAVVILYAQPKRLYSRAFSANYFKRNNLSWCGEGTDQS